MLRRRLIRAGGAFTPSPASAVSSFACGRLPACDGPLRRHPRRRADERLRARRRGRLRAALRAPPGRPLPLRPPPARHARSRRRPTRCSRTPGCASCNARERWAAAGRDLSHLAVHARPSPRHRPAAQERPRSLGRCVRGRRRRAVAARRRRLAALAGAGRRRAARRGARVLAPRRREAARLPRAAAAAAAQRLPAASRRRPRARRGRARARGRLRDREDAAALRDEQAAHLHGRLPRAAATAEGSR